MANGCIVADCPICGDSIYEDEWKITGKIMHHNTCNVTKFITIFSKLSVEEQKKVLMLAGKYVVQRYEDSANFAELNRMMRDAKDIRVEA